MLNQLLKKLLSLFNKGEPQGERQLTAIHCMDYKTQVERDQIIQAFSKRGFVVRDYPTRVHGESSFIEILQ